MNISTHKIIESENVRIDEFTKRIKEERKKELEDYRKFVYYKPDTLPNLFEIKETSSLNIPKSPMVIEL